MLWEVAADPGFRRPVRSGVARTGPEHDHTVHVDVRGLRPATTYHYRFRADWATSPVGRTRTAPSPRSDTALLRFGTASCTSFEAGYFAAYRYLAARGDLDAVLHLGDYTYEFALGNGVRPVEPPHLCLTLADYRARHGCYRTDPDLQALHAAAPFVTTWDDHEVADNAWANGAPRHDETTMGTWADRVAAAKRAYFEWLPVRREVADSTQRRLSFGRLADLTMLDLRSFRSQQVEPGDTAGLDDPSRTITGRRQMAWLKDGLTRGTAVWNLVGSSVMAAPWLLPTGLPDPATTVNTDQWDGYRAERTELFTHLRDLGVRNTVFLTGDLHSSWAGEIRLPGEPAPVASQFVVTSTTQITLGSLFPGGIGSRLVDAVLRLNPHLTWGEVDSNGCGVLEVTDDGVRMDWQRVADKTRPDSAVTHMASWAVDRTTGRVVPAAG